MKRVMCLIFLALFILSTCRPNTGGQGQAATAMQEATATLWPTSTWTPEPTPTPTHAIKKDMGIIVNPKFPDFSQYLSNKYVRMQYSPITLDDFISGRVQEAEEEFLKTNNPVSSEVISSNTLNYSEYGLKINNRGCSIEIKYLNYPKNSEYTKNSKSRPIQFLSYYPIVDLELYEKLGLTQALQERYPDRKFDENYYYEGPKLVLVSWLNYNFDGTTTIGHTLLDPFGLKGIELHIKENDPNLDFRFLPAYDYGKVVRSNLELDNMGCGFIYPVDILEGNPNLKPDPKLIKKWADTGIMPSELERSLFIFIEQSISW